MNKIVKSNYLGFFIPLRICILTIMRVFLLIIVLGLGSVYANPSYAQTKIDINVSNIGLEELFAEIQNKSEFVFFYKDATLDKNKKISLKFKINLAGFLISI